MDETTQGSATYESLKEAEGKRASDKVSYWLDELDLASKDEKEWRKAVDDATQTFRGEKGSEGTAFNIYFANIQTLVPALYNSTPIADVRRRFGDNDPVGAFVAEFLERGLSYSVDSYDFDQSVKSSVFDLAMPGRGLLRVAYHATMGEVEGVEDVVDQNAICEYVPWDQFRRGPGKRWSDVPWIAFQHHYTREALAELVDSETASKVPQDASYAPSGDQNKNPTPEATVMKLTEVWEIWDKRQRKVLFIAPSFKDKPLLEQEDPLDLEGFFPIPEPMLAVRQGGTVKPVCEYQIYKELLIELDDITKRIRRLIGQLRPRAAFGGKASNLKALADADDGELVEMPDLFLDGPGGMDKLISWFPLDTTSKAIAELAARREQVKQNIFEVTGMADIMRGQSDPNETLGAQQIKAKWGALRIQERQKEVQRFVRDLFRLKAEIICSKFNLPVLAGMLGMQAEPELMMQAFQLMQNDGLRGFRVDIETDSTVQNSMSHDLDTMTQFVQATGTFFQSMAPAAQMGIMPPPAIAQLFAAFAKSFNLGSQADALLEGLPDQVAQMQQQMQQQPNPEQQKLQAEQEANQQEFQLKAAESQMKVQGEQQKMGLEQQRHEQQMGFDFEKHQQTMQLEREKMAQQAQIEQQKMAVQSQTAAADRKAQVSIKKNDWLQQSLMAKTEAGKKKRKMEDDEDIMPLEQIQKAFFTLSQALAQQAQMMQQANQQLMQGLQQIGEMIMAEAELVTDANGRPVGARKVLPNKQAMN
jgi:hypothetical protein